MQETNFRGQPIERGQLAVVLGAGRSGKAAVRLLQKKGARVRLLEKNPGALNDAERAEFTSLDIDWRIKEHAPDDFLGARFVVLSPGIPMVQVLPLLDQEALASGALEVLAEMELAYRYLTDEPILAVTGTSGKTTTVSVAAAMLKQQGYSVFLGGNIGTPLSEYILAERKADVLVLEISSFQLQTCTTFAPRVAVLLNLSPNHLDYHKDMAEYIQAKFRLFRWQDGNDLAVLGSDLEPLAAKFGLRARKVFINDTDRFPKMQLIGPHNRFNCEAAWQATRFFGVSLANASEAVAKFHPLPNRLERVREHESVLYINDSKSTTVAALKVALEAMERPVRLLCGGKFKGGDLKSLLPIIKTKVKQVALFGAAREEFESAWQGEVPISWHPNLDGAVDELFHAAEVGDVVLLSPATASFDLYKNYVERGTHFRKLVEALP